jgi:chlorobactene glucosyltransferase
MDMVIWILLTLSVVIAIIFSFQLFVSLQRYRLKNYSYQPLTEADMPTVSVCIPARNETYSLADCLQSVLSSDYEKLEIIVYDDCSQDKTSNIIKSFAHDGVRFIQGESPAEGWLGKNYACETLAAQANGQYLLFMGVDTRIETTTISQLISYARSKHVGMVSVLPRRRDSGWRASVVFSPLRYFMQLIVPQWLHTPASTAFWLIRSDALKEMGGFGEVRNQVTPEVIFARTFDTSGSYRYLISTDSLGVFYAKKWRSQIDTTVRLTYPTLKKQPLFVILAVSFMYGTFVIPYLLVVTALMTMHWDGQSLVALGLTCVYALLYLLYAQRIWRRGWLVGALVVPYLILQEIALIITSMIAYAFGKVDWKGRNICYPVLRRIK